MNDTMNDTIITLGLNLLATAISKIDSTPAGEEWRKSALEIADTLGQEMLKMAQTVKERDDVYR